jgi:hypothetical protein
MSKSSSCLAHLLLSSSASLWEEAHIHEVLAMLLLLSPWAASVWCFLELYEEFIVKEGILDHRLFQTMNFPILLFVCTIDGMQHFSWHPSVTNLT